MQKIFLKGLAPRLLLKHSQQKNVFLKNHSGFFHLNRRGKVFKMSFETRKEGSERERERETPPPKNNWTNLFQIKKTEQHKNIVLAIIINGKNFIALIKKYAKAKLCPWRGGGIVVTRLLHCQRP